MRSSRWIALMLLVSLGVLPLPRATAAEPPNAPSPVTALPPVEQSQEIVLRVEVLELSRTKLRTLGFDFAMPKVTSESEYKVSTSSLAAMLNRTGPGDAFLGFLDALRQDQMVQTLAKHEVVLASGRAGHVRIGSEFATAALLGLVEASSATTFLGSDAEYTAQLHDDGTVQLDYRVSVGKLIEEFKPTKGSVVPAYVFQVDFDSSMKLRLGEPGAASQMFTRQAKIVRGNPNIPIQRNIEARAEELEVVLLVTAELVEAK